MITETARRSEYYTSGIMQELPSVVGKEQKFQSIDQLRAIPKFSKTVDLCLQAFEGKIGETTGEKMKVFNNGDIPYVPASKKEMRFFTRSVEGLKHQEIDSASILRVPAQLSVGNELYSVIQVFDKKKKIFGDWCLVDDNKRLVLENGKPKSLAPKDAIVTPAELRDSTTGAQVYEYTERDIVKEEIEQLVAKHCKDLLDTSGTDNNPKLWAQIFEIAPELITIFNSNSAHIDGVLKSHALNIVDVALQVARNPKTSITIKTGFGGTDGDFTSARLASYAIPALDTAQKIRDFSEQRKTKGKSGLSNPPQVQFIFAEEAAIAVNFTDNPNAVHQRTTDNIAVLEKFAHDNYPGVPVDFIRDIPWSEQSAETKLYREFIAQNLRDHNKHSIRETLDELVKFGHKHGSNGSTRDTAAIYAAIHQMVFDLASDFPNPEYLDFKTPEQKAASQADVVVVIGGQTERHFDAAMFTALAEATYENFSTFINSRMVSSNTYIQPISQEEVDEARQSLSQKEVEASNRKVIPLISKIGEHKPPYFLVPEYDVPHTFDFDLALEKVQTDLRDIQQRIREISAGQNNEGIDIGELAVQRSILEGIKYDMMAIKKVTD